MKVILYMATTANGMIAREDGDSGWVSPEDTKSFTNVCRKAGAVIMGRRTYQVLAPNDLPLKKGMHVVLTRNTLLRSSNSTVTFTQDTPKKILTALAKKGFKEVCVIGGSQTYTLFLKEKLVDEIYVDVEPLLFGKGMSFCLPTSFEYKLKLLSLKKLNKNTVQLHYKVLK